MSVSSQGNVADAVLDLEDACELQEHEFTFDPDDAGVTGAHPVARPRPATPPPPPPVRRAPTAQLRAAESGAPDTRPRHGSGVFNRPDAHTEGAEVARLRAQLRARDAYLVELERALDERTRQLSQAGIQSIDDVARMLGQLRGQAFRIAELESELRNVGLYAAELRAAARSGEPASSGQLQRVRGIGPRYAAPLEPMVVERLSQIAQWSEEDVARVAGVLHIAPSRIEREGWIDQARALQGSSAALDQDA